MEIKTGKKVVEVEIEALKMLKKRISKDFSDVVNLLFLCKGKIVISKKLTGNDLTIYLQLDKDNFYYFNYKKGLMKVYSSNEDFNKIISETKKDETKSKIKGLPDYQYMLGAAKDVAPFVATYMK